ncbi:thioredoxin [Dysgonomonas sp. 520]|uniref:thioredoxin n=1 Tax=Dysgonomonas sp. 520 TaxID=2302931 RepID=UPI00162ABDD1|nr:thioredoxin [Dysgonomonas sp. 520]
MKTSKLSAALFLAIAILLISCKKETNKEQKDNEIVKIESNENRTKKGSNMKTIKLTKTEFLTKVANYEANPEWKYLGDKPALIDFYADWCGPCKAIAPTLEELAAEYGDQIYIYKIDTDKEQELAALFGIRSIPSLLFIPMNGQPQMSQGAVPKPELKSAIDKILLNK